MYGYKNPTIRMTEKNEIVGPKMHNCLLLTENTVYPSMNQLAKTVGPHNSQQYGYAIVNRCLSKKLLKLEKNHPKATKNGKGAVLITEKGKQFLNNIE